MRTVGGHVDGDSRQVHFSPNLDWEAVPLGHLLVEATGIEAVNAENDATSLAVAEQLFGDGGGRGSFAVVKVRSGVGGPSLDTTEALADLAAEGDHAALAAIERAGEALGRGLSMLVNLLNLELVVLYAEEPLLNTPIYLQAVQDSLAAHAFSSAASDCRMIPKVLTDVEEARAAASMAFQRFYPST